MTYIIGVAGPTCSGKSTLCKEYVRRFGGEHLRLDDYYHHECDFPLVDGVPNWEDPASLRLDELHAHLDLLRQDQPAIVPCYDKRSGRICGEREVRPREQVIVEGFLLYHHQGVREVIDQHIFIACDVNTIEKRRFERQPNLDHRYFRDVIMPTAVAMSKEACKYADHIINGARPAEQVFETFTSLVSQLRTGK
jgi:nicotinamide/nicotinate riboside kinase